MDETTFDTLARDIARLDSIPRRTVLGALTGTVALAAGALLPLGASDEAEAKSKKKKRRRRRKKRNRATPPGASAPLMNIRVILENHTPSSIDAEGWVPIGGNPQECRKRYQETIQPNLTPTFAPGRPVAEVWIKGKYYIEIRDRDPDEGFPNFDLIIGGEMSKKCFKPDYTKLCNQGVAFNVELGVGQKYSIPANGCHDGIEIERDGDTGNERVFRIRVIA